MILLFKITGFIFIIFTTSAIGFYKANALNLRYKKLCALQKSMVTLKEGIRLHSGEAEQIIRLSFDEFPVEYTYLKKEDAKLLDEFFFSFGNSDTAAEYERCEFYLNLLKTRAEDAKKQHSELARLYKNVGVLSGILICIFFL